MIAINLALAFGAGVLTGIGIVFVLAILAGLFFDVWLDGHADGAE